MSTTCRTRPTSPPDLPLTTVPIQSPSATRRRTRPNDAEQPVHARTDPHLGARRAATSRMVGAPNERKAVGACGSRPLLARCATRRAASPLALRSGVESGRMALRRVQPGHMPCRMSRLVAGHSESARDPAGDRSPTDDDVPVTLDGRRLDTPEKLLASSRRSTHSGPRQLLVPGEGAGGFDPDGGG